MILRKGCSSFKSLTFYTSHIPCCNFLYSSNSSKGTPKNCALRDNCSTLILVVESIRCNSGRGISASDFSWITFIYKWEIMFKTMITSLWSDLLPRKKHFFCSTILKLLLMLLLLSPHSMIGFAFFSTSVFSTLINNVCQNYDTIKKGTRMFYLSS